MEIKGKVVANLGVQKGTSKAGKEWAKATVVVEYGDQYPKKIALDNMKNADGFGALAIGTEGTFHIEVESREFNGRWYTSANCWKWEAGTQTQPQEAPPFQTGAPNTYGYQQPKSAGEIMKSEKKEYGDDLPF